MGNTEDRIGLSISFLSEAVWYISLHLTSGIDCKQWIWHWLHNALSVGHCTMNLIIASPHFLYTEKIYHLHSIF